LGKAYAQGRLAPLRREQSCKRLRPFRATRSHGKPSAQS
jgi:hypothetical protein